MLYFSIFFACVLTTICIADDDDDCRRFFEDDQRRVGRNITIRGYINKEYTFEDPPTFFISLASDVKLMKPYSHLRIVYGQRQFDPKQIAYIVVGSNAPIGPVDTLDKPIVYRSEILPRYEDFNIVIKMEMTHFKIYFQGAPVTDFVYLAPLNTMTTICFNGDFSLKQIQPVPLPDD